MDKKQWINIKVVENGYSIETHLQDFVATTLQQLLKVIEENIVVK